eukprot:gnl/TRDRNA2_/TRDRNA2_211605_c0_seq1.p2 gnl/TRDRNA2_/TRDRNA2_211605_c0~~gnl/TRDRNA2_/TRDRNA2_211605_c0_seq1.p2  ORF type:complete len:125 (-),score=15.18 gnl/TRDRNA2_/TRDRNA2_211605_c0_seq1:8-382(-)
MVLHGFVANLRKRARLLRDSDRPLEASVSSDENMLFEKRPKEAVRLPDEREASEASVAAEHLEPLDDGALSTGRSSAMSSRLLGRTVVPGSSTSCPLRAIGSLRNVTEGEIQAMPAGQKFSKKN